MLFCLANCTLQRDASYLHDKIKKCVVDKLTFTSTRFELGRKALLGDNLVKVSECECVDNAGAP